MKLLLVAILVLKLKIYAIYGFPLSSTDQQPEVIYQFDNHDTDTFSWGYQLSDGRSVSQNGYFKELEDGSKALVITGSYSYIGPDGTKYMVKYRADENGYHPKVTVGEVPPPTVGLDPKVLISLVG